MCTIMFGLTQADDVYESPASSSDNGFPDLVMRPDMATARPLPWCDGTVAVLCDLYGPDGAPYPVAPRTVLRTVADRCAELGFEARFAAELELCVVHQGDDAVPLGRTMNAYSLLRLRETAAARAGVLRAHGGGRHPDRVGAHRARPRDAGVRDLARAGREAADHAARAKAYLKELCGEMGLVATFMPKWRSGAPTSGCHFHQSLWRDGGQRVLVG